MKYINIDDIMSAIQENMILASIEKQLDILDMLESQVIDEVKSYIGGRFDVEKIFADAQLKNGMLVRIIICITVYRAVRRNAARKVPENYEEMNTWAYDALTRIRDGIMPLPGLPEVIDSETDELSLYWVDKRKNEYYL